MTRTIRGMRTTGRFTVACRICPRSTSTTYARKHDGMCKHCAEPASVERHATRDEQHARYIDCGPAAWDDR